MIRRLYHHNAFLPVSLRQGGETTHGAWLCRSCVKIARKLGWLSLAGDDPVNYQESYDKKHQPACCAACGTRVGVQS